MQWRLTFFLMQVLRPVDVAPLVSWRIHQAVLFREAVSIYYSDLI
jgi:hypothetical protein